MNARFVTVHIALPELRGMLPGAETTVSTSFWVPLTKFVLERAQAFEVICRREDRETIKLLMPCAETVERRHEDGALMFWGPVVPAVARAITGGHGGGHEALWWWQMTLTHGGDQVFVLEGYGERMDVFGLSDTEAAFIVELLPFSARTTRIVQR